MCQFWCMEDTITIKEVLLLMESGRAFSLTVVTANTKKGTGGELVSFPSATCTGYNVKDGTKLTASVMKKATSEEKRPNHSEHFTRNILLPDMRVRKIHIDLITRFNGKKVL